MDQNLMWGIIEISVGFLMITVMIYNGIKRKNKDEK